MSAGEGHFALVTDSLHLYMCGKNSFGQLGLGHTRTVATPTLIPVRRKQSFGDVKVEMASCGAEHTLVLTGTRELYACGLNVKGQLGTGDTENRSSPTLIDSFLRLKGGKSPTPPGKADRVALIGCGALHSVISTGDSHIDKNKVWTCGFGQTYALGHSAGADSHTFSPVSDLDMIGKIERVACGVAMSGVIIQGNLYIWGTVNGSVNQTPTLVPFPPDSRGKATQSPPLKSSTPRNGYAQDVCFADEACVVLTKGEVWAWGEGPGLNHREPVRVLFPQEVVSISAGLTHAAAVTSDYQLYIWGKCDLGQLCSCESENQGVTLVKSYEGSNPFQVACGSYSTFCISYKAPVRLQCNRTESPQGRRSCTSTVDSDCPHHEEAIRLRKEVEDLKRQLQQQEEVKEEHYKRRSRSHAYFEYNVPKSNAKPSRQLNRKSYSACFEIPYEELELLGDQIGKGGYGTVYRSKWRGTIVAVKKLRIDMPIPPEKYTEFLSSF